VKWPRCIVDF